MVSVIKDSIAARMEIICLLSGAYAVKVMPLPGRAQITIAHTKHMSTEIEQNEPLDDAMEAMRTELLKLDEEKK